MSNSPSSFIKISQEDTIVESRELIKTLFSVLKDCDLCASKLKNLLSIVGTHPATAVLEDKSSND